MIPYFTLLATWSIGAINFSSDSKSPASRIFYGFLLAVTIIMVGLRYQVGGDWETYLDMYNSIYFLDFSNAIELTDPGYALLNMLALKFDGGVYLVNLGCALIFMLGLSNFVRMQPRPWLAMTVAIPYLVIVVGMGYTRQAAAIGCICWAIARLEDDSILQTVVKIAIAAMFHKTAILFLPILLAPSARRNSLSAVVGFVMFFGLAAIALGGSSDRLVTNYVNSDYQSSGAAVRVSMNVLAGILFLTLRKRFHLSKEQRLIWTICALLSAASVVGLAVSSSSVGVDRLALFLIPLQVFVYSNLPALPGLNSKNRSLVVLGVLFYCFAIEYVYLVHGSFSYTWLPYRNILVADRTG